MQVGYQREDTIRKVDALMVSIAVPLYLYLPPPSCGGISDEGLMVINNS
jgi:hypothetical protein